MLKKAKLFKNKKQMIIYLISFLVIIILFIVIGTYDFKNDDVNNKKEVNNVFSQVPSNNVFTKTNASEVNMFLNSNDSNIVLFGFDKSIWTNYAAKYIDEVAKEYDVKKIYYYDFELDRKNSNGTYENIVNKLNAYLVYDDYNVAHLRAPSLLFIKDGNVLSLLQDTSLRVGDISACEYYTDLEIMMYKDKLRLAFEDYLGV